MSLLLKMMLAVAWMAPAVRAEPVAPDPLAAIEAAQQQVFVRLAPSVVFIHTKTSFGSGFMVSRDGLVLTNAHVVDGQSTVGVITHDGQKLTGTVLDRAKKADLALIQLPLAQTEPIPLGDSELLRVGAWVGAIGHGRGGIWTFNTGMISNIYPAESGRPVFQTQIPLNPGASGGPILDRKGQVIGIVTSGIVDAESINFGIKIDVALRELKPLAARCECLVVLAPEGVPVLVDGVMRGVGPRVVVPVGVGSHEVVAVIKDSRRRFTLQFPEQRSVTLGPDTPASAGKDAIRGPL